MALLRPRTVARLSFQLALVALLTACGTNEPVAQAPVEVTRVVTQVVPRVVTKVATQIVVVTATPELAEPTATLEPTAMPEATAAPEPTVAPDPTSPPALAEGESVPGRIVRTIRILDIPNEAEGKEVLNAAPGNMVDVLYRGGQWYQIHAVSTSNKDVEGWVYRDWIAIAPEDEVRIPAYPDALPVIVTEIKQTVGNDGKKYWTGKVMNVGAKPAYDVQVEISLNGQVGDTETRADRGQAFVAARNLDSGQASAFNVQTAWVRDDNVFYSYRVLWTAH